MNPEQTTESTTVWIFQIVDHGIPDVVSVHTTEDGARAAWNRAMACVAHDRENDGLNMRCEVNAECHALRDSWDYGYFMDDGSEYRIDISELSA